MCFSQLGGPQMARITFSPLMVDARGSVSDTVFSVWKGIHYIRSRIVPHNPKSDDQIAQRDALSHTLTLWQSVKSWSKAVWDTYATGYPLSGYNRYVQDNIKLVKAGTAGVLTPYLATYIPISAMDAAAGGAGEIACSWTNDSGVHGTDYVTAYYHKLEAEAEVYAWSHGGVKDVDQSPLTITGLDTAESYEVAFFCHTDALAEVQQSYNEVLAAG